MNTKPNKPIDQEAGQEPEMSDAMKETLHQIGYTLLGCLADSLNISLEWSTAGEGENLKHIATLSYENMEDTVIIITATNKDRDRIGNLVTQYLGTVNPNNVKGYKSSNQIMEEALSELGEEIGAISANKAFEQEKGASPVNDSRGLVQDSYPAEEKSHE